MVFQNKELLDLCSFSERTFYRRMEALRQKNIFKKKMEGNYLSLEDAMLIADRLGFKMEFEKYLKEKKLE